MKKKLFTILFLGIMLIPAMAQSTNGSGSFTTENGFVLESNTQQLPYSFVINIDSQSSFVDLKDYFNSYNTLLSTIELDPNKGTVTISLEARAQPSWQLRDWNDYLNKIHTKANSNLNESTK